MRKSTVCLPTLVVNERAKVPVRRFQRRHPVLEEERERIKRDLHDGVLQTLYAAGLGMAAAKADMTSAPPSVVGQINFAASQVDHAIREIRALLQHDLDPAHSEDMSLDAAMRTTIEGLIGTSSLRCQVAIDPQAAEALTQEQGTQVLYILREALSNVLRHAQAESVTVALKSNEARRITLEVQDDGIGFVERPLARTHYGIKNLSQRSTAMGGQLQIISSSDLGTRLVLEFDGGVACLPNL